MAACNRGAAGGVCTPNGCNRGAAAHAWGACTPNGGRSAGAAQAGGAWQAGRQLQLRQLRVVHAAIRCPPACAATRAPGARGGAAAHQAPAAAGCCTRRQTTKRNARRLQTANSDNEIVWASEGPRARAAAGVVGCTGALVLRLRLQSGNAMQCNGPLRPAQAWTASRAAARPPGRGLPGAVFYTVAVHLHNPRSATAATHNVPCVPPHHHAP